MTDRQDMGASALPSGSRASHEAPSGLHPSGFDPSRDDTDELLADLAQAALEHDGDLIIGNLFQLAHATVAAQAAEIRRLLLVNGQLALEWARQKDREDAIAMEAREGGDGATRLHAKHDSAARRDRPSSTSIVEGN